MADDDEGTPASRANTRSAPPRMSPYEALRTWHFLGGRQAARWLECDTVAARHVNLWVLREFFNALSRRRMPTVIGCTDPLTLIGSEHTDPAVHQASNVDMSVDDILLIAEEAAKTGFTLRSDELEMLFTTGFGDGASSALTVWVPLLNGPIAKWIVLQALRNGWRTISLTGQGLGAVIENVFVGATLVVAPWCDSNVASNDETALRRLASVLQQEASFGVHHVTVTRALPG